MLCFNRKASIFQPKHQKKTSQVTSTTYKLINPKTHQPQNSSTRKLINSKAHQLKSPSTQKPINLKTQKLINPKLKSLT